MSVEPAPPPPHPAPIHVVVSPYKTGTTSIEQALVTLGIGAAPMPYNGAALRQWLPRLRRLNARAFDTENPKRWLRKRGPFVRERLAAAYPFLNRFDIFADAPFGHGHIHPLVIAALAPEARFIWVNRDFDDWINSLRKWELAHPKTYSAKRLALWQKSPDDMVELMRHRWHSRHKAFRQIAELSPSQCLELTFEDFTDYSALSNFYGVRAPEGTLPRLNASDG